MITHNKDFSKIVNMSNAGLEQILEANFYDNSDETDTEVLCNTSAFYN